MHEHIINMLYFFSSSMKALNNKMMSNRFKRLERRRIKLLISKNKNLKRCFEPKSMKKRDIMLPIKPDIKFHVNTSHVYVGSLYKGVSS